MDKDKKGTRLRSYVEKGRDFWAIYKQNRSGIVGLGILAAFLVMAIFAPWITPYGPYNLVSGPMAPPNVKNLLGTDELGRDILTRLIYGARVSLVIGVVATLISVLIGTLIGLFSGYLGGVTDDLSMRVTDFFIMMPGVSFLIVLATLLGPSMWNIILAISILGWTRTARIVRSSTLSLKTREFVEASKSFGAGPTHIVYRHILPNILPLIFATAVLGVPEAILSEAGIAFFGLGDPFMISWGTMLHYAQVSAALVRGAWWYILPPGLCIALIAVSFALVARTLDQIINPKLRRR
jgi:ABC-type dipeptide/oligopeptide/nickel transport system permease subunit